MIGCHHVHVGGDITNPDAVMLLSACRRPARYLLAWAVEALPNPRAPYRERLPREQAEFVAASCAVHLPTLNAAQTRELERRGELGAPRGVNIFTIEGAPHDDQPRTAARPRTGAAVRPA